MKKLYKVFCANCKMEYSRIVEPRPTVCGVCGDSWIAVKETIDPQTWITCPACSYAEPIDNADRKDFPDGSVVYTCRTCDGVHSPEPISKRVRQSYLSYIWDTTKDLSADLSRYFDFILWKDETDHSRGTTRSHGWYNRESKKLIQIG